MALNRIRFPLSFSQRLDLYENCTHERCVCCIESFRALAATVCMHSNVERQHELVYWLVHSVCTMEKSTPNPMRMKKVEAIATAKAAAPAPATAPNIFPTLVVQNKYWQSITSFGAIVIQPNNTIQWSTATRTVISYKQWRDAQAHNQSTDWSYRCWCRRCRCCFFPFFHSVRVSQCNIRNFAIQTKHNSHHNSRRLASNPYVQYLYVWIDSSRVGSADSFVRKPSFRRIHRTHREIYARKSSANQIGTFDSAFFHVAI